MSYNHDINELLLKMYSQADDSYGVFYANIFYNVNRVLDNKMETAGVGMSPTGKLTLTYNQDFINKFDANVNITLLKHEAAHIVYKHITRAKLDNINDKLNFQAQNIAMDVVINQFLNQDHIKTLNGITLEKFSETIKKHNPNVEVKKNQTWEYYYDLMKTNLPKTEIPKLGSGMDSHEGFGQSNQETEGISESFANAIIDDIISKAINSAAGNVPSYVKENFMVSKNPQLPWQQIIKQFVGDSLRISETNSRTIRNRRYGLIYPGKKKDYKAKILVGIDTSGSMSNEMIEKCLSEIYGIYKTQNNLDLDIVECDAVIQDVFTYTGKNSFKISGRGGTQYQPIFEHAKNNKYDGVIILGDADYFDNSLNNYKIKTIWGVIKNEKFTPPFGKKFTIK